MTSWKASARVVALLVLLSGITYLDRICISVAGPRMQADLHIGAIGWSWVTGVFTIAYCLFEIPSGILVDRIGPRRVLTRIVLWWSTFTALTGTVTGLVPLLIVRFLFGVGEAGAFPSAGGVISRWFSASRRATLSGVVLMSSQFGGALAPLLVVPIQVRFGWRAAFFIFGAVGIFWVVAWRVWFRDFPDGRDSKPQERPPHAAFPWRVALRTTTIRALLGTAFCYVYVFNFFQTWFHTFLVKGRGFSEWGLMLSIVPYLVAALGNLAGGAASDALVRRLGVKRGRRRLGSLAQASAGMLIIAAMVSRQQALTMAFLALAYGAITLQQSAVFGVCLDLGKEDAGAVVGLMNTASQAGGFVGAVAYGYIVDHFGSYDAPFVPMAALLFLGATLWLKIDASQDLRAVANQSSARS
jgi:MFS family permease